MDVPKVAGAMLARIEGDLRKDVVGIDPLQNQMHRRAMPAHQHEVHPFGERRGKQRRVIGLDWCEKLSGPRAERFQCLP